LNSDYVSERGDRAWASRVVSKRIVFVTASAREAPAASRYGFGEAGQTFGGGRISAFANNDDVVKRYRTLGTVVED
jgi:hypothetical protein